MIRMIGVLCLLAPAVAFAQPSGPDNDGAEAYGAAWNAWQPGLWCHLLDDDTPFVRALASMTLQARASEGSAAACPDDGAPPDLPALRRQAIDDDPSNAALATTVYAFDCLSSRPAPWCEASDLPLRLATLDPDNAYAHLLALRGIGRSGREDNLPFSGEELEHVLRAASASHVDTYWGHGLPETWLAVEAAVDSLPPLVFEGEALAQAREAGLEHTPVTDMATIELIAVQVALAQPSWSRLYGGCQASIRSGDDIAEAGCTTLADLMETKSQTYLVQSIGRGLTSQMATIVRGETREPKRSWQSQLSGVMQYCWQPRGLVTESRLPGPMPEDHLYRYLSDGVSLGEARANQDTATREYERYPEAFPLDPRRCEDILDLPPDTLESLVTRWNEAMTEGFDAWDDVLRDAAKQLD